MKVVRLSLTALALIAILSCAEEATPTQPTAPSIKSFTAGAWTLNVDRAWDGQTGSPQFPSDALDESAYKTVSNTAAYQIAVSSGGQAATVVGSSLSGTITGERVKSTDSLVQYTLSSGTFAGGRLVVWSSGSGLQGELTFYGSGVPITKSERGPVIAR